MNNKETINQVLDALMSISVKGNDVITMANCLQALDGVLRAWPEENKVSIEPEVVED